MSRARKWLPRAGGLCGAMWGSHACSLPSDHDGDHQCTEDDEICSAVDQRGVDHSGFEWSLWGVEGWPEWTPQDGP